MFSTYLFIGPSSMSNPMVIMLVIIMFILLLAIGLLANVVLGAAAWYHNKEKEQEKEKKNNTASTITAACVTGLLLFAMPVFAQDTQTAAAVAAQATTPLEGVSSTAFYLMSGVIAIELLVLFVLLYQLRVFIAREKKARVRGEEAAPSIRKWKSIWSKLNRFRPAEQEADIDLGHDYDGIRELDNRLPPWWLYGFYLSILIGSVYFWRYHIAHTAPLSGDEYRIAMQEAEVQKIAYLKKAANNVDENTVTLVTDAAALAGGKTIFEQNCSACHGKAGEGIVGPNLTDDYWLHGGSISDVFKTIKYGWPEKGMKSWKDDLSPVQIGQIASYIKNMKGSNPPNAKEKQGELYQETGNTLPGKDTVVHSTVTKIATAGNDQNNSNR